MHVISVWIEKKKNRIKAKRYDDSRLKSTKENYVRAIEDFTGLVLEKALLDKMYVCETCASKCQMSVNFKEACVDNIRDFEKLHKRQNSTFFLEAVSC